MSEPSTTAHYEEHTVRTWTDDEYGHEIQVQHDSEHPEHITIDTHEGTTVTLDVAGIPALIRALSAAHDAVTGKDKEDE